jgi:transposase
VRTACDQHDVGSGAIYTWRQQAMSGELTGVRQQPEPSFAEVQISEPAVLPMTPACMQGNSPIGIVLPSGIKLTVDATVDAAALARVIGVLTQ